MIPLTLPLILALALFARWGEKTKGNEGYAML
jgi:hypothetical protein